MTTQHQFYRVAMLLTLHLPLLAMSPQETRASAPGGDRPLGLEFLDPRRYDSIPFANLPLSGDLPEELDLAPYFPAPGNQGKQSSCVGWATAYAVKSYQEGIEHRWKLDDDAHLFSPAYIYNQGKRRSRPDELPCSGGMIVIDALNLLQEGGVCRLSSFPYSESDCDRLPTDAEKKEAEQYIIAAWRKVNVQSTVDVKAHIAAGTPVLLGIDVNQAFKELGNTTYDRFIGPSLGGHAIVCIGYSTNRNAFKLLNSWGRSWGDGGYGWVDYDVLSIIAREAYVLHDVDLNGRSPRPETSATVPMTAKLDLPILKQNVTIRRSEPGLAITVRGTVKGPPGTAVQVVVRFTDPDGSPIRPRSDAKDFVDSAGNVAITRSMNLSERTAKLKDLTFSIPYQALDPPSLGRRVDYMLYSVVLREGKEVARSESVPFFFNW